MVSRLTFITLSAVVYNYNNNINIIMSINTFFKVRDGRIRVYKKYVYKYVPFFSGLRCWGPHAQLLYLSPSVSTVSISLGSILSFLQTVILFFFISLSLSLSLAHAHFLVLSYSRHSGNIHILIWFHLRPMLRICYITRIYVYHCNIIIIIIINIHSIRDNSSDNNDNILHVKWHVGSFSSQ